MVLQEIHQALYPLADAKAREGKGHFSVLLGGKL